MDCDMKALRGVRGGVLLCRWATEFTVTVSWKVMRATSHIISVECSYVDRWNSTMKDFQLLGQKLIEFLHFGIFLNHV